MVQQKLDKVSLAGKTVLLIHPAWHSCGSHTVFVGQAAAYSAMGAKVVSLAVGTTLDQNSRNKDFWNFYYSKTGDLMAETRAHTGPSRYSLLFDSSRRRTALDLKDADYARQMAGISELSPMPAGITNLPKIDLIHCNHFFNMPLALQAKKQFGAPILLETHDVQARQYELRDAAALITKRKASFDEMLKSELSFVQQADIVCHINSEEHEFFRKHLPDRKHVLLYPPVRQPTRPIGNHFFLIVASANYPNYQSVGWLLERVLPLCSSINLKIIGNVDYEFSQRSPALLQRYKASFVGRADDLTWLYQNAVSVLLPTISGHGLSIKTIEAMETGAPMIATTLAFRGINADLSKIDNLTLADTPEAFAAAIEKVDCAALAEEREKCEGIISHHREHEPADVGRARQWILDYERELKRRTAGSRRVADDLFSFPKYVGTLESIASGLLVV